MTEEARSVGLSTSCKGSHSADGRRLSLLTQNTQRAGNSPYIEMGSNAG